LNSRDVQAEDMLTPAWSWRVVLIRYAMVWWYRHRWWANVQTINQSRSTYTI